MLRGWQSTGPVKFLLVEKDTAKPLRQMLKSCESMATYSSPMRTQK
jgi:hypothetical protein